MIPNNSNQTVVSGINALSAIMSDNGEIPQHWLEALCGTLTMHQAIMTNNPQLITRVIEIKSSEINLMFTSWVDGSSEIPIEEVESSLDFSDLFDGAVI